MKIKAYILREPDKKGRAYMGYFSDIENSLEAKQELVGGNIEVLPITPEIDAIINEEGKLKGLGVNRILSLNPNEANEVLVGNIICVRHNEEGEFISILDSDKEIIDEMLIPVKCFMELPQEDGGSGIFVLRERKLFDYEEDNGKD